MPPVSVPGDEAVLAATARELVDRARGDGMWLTSDGGLRPALILQIGLNVELDDHLGHEP